MAKKRRKLNKDFERKIYSSKKNVELVLAKIYDIDDEDIQKEYIQNEKKSIIIFLFVITALAYFYPVIKHAKNKLDCEAIAKNYITKNKNTNGINNKEIKMLSTNFCYGGEEIYEIENLKN